MRARMAAIDGAGRRDRHRRHRRRRLGHAQHLDRGGLRRRRLRRAGGQARQPRAVVAIRGGRRADRARRQRRRAARAAAERAGEAGIGFLMAPRHHRAMRHAAGPRVELGTRTIFNLLGPLSNPARVRRQLTGVFAPEWAAADGRDAGPARHRDAPGSCTAQGHGRDLTIAGDDPGGRAARTAGSANSGRPGGCRAATRAPLEAIRGRRAGAERRRRCAALLQGATGRLARHRAAQCRRRADRGRPGRRSARGRRRLAARARSTVRRRAAALGDAAPRDRTRTSTTPDHRRHRGADILDPHLRRQVRRRCGRAAATPAGARCERQARERRPPRGFVRALLRGGGAMAGTG